MAPTTIANDIIAPKTALAKKKSTAKSKKKNKGKYSGKPKRPLSAYNLFFQHERDRILRNTASPFGRDDVSHDAHYRTLGSDPSVRTTGRPKKSHPPPHGKVGFAQLAKMIGARWKDLSDEELAEYESLASKEKERYDRDLWAWQLREAFDRYGDESDRATFVSAAGDAGVARNDRHQSIDVASLLRPQQPHQPQPSSVYNAWHSPAAIGRLLAPPVVHSASPDRAYSNASLGSFRSGCQAAVAAPAVCPAVSVSSGSFADYYAQHQRSSTSASACLAAPVVSSGSFADYYQRPSPASATTSSLPSSLAAHFASAPAVAKPVVEGRNAADAAWPILNAKPVVESSGGGTANAAWPVLDVAGSGSNGGSGGSSTSAAAALDADISRMIDLLMG